VPVQVISDQLETQSKDRSKAIKKLHRVRRLQRSSLSARISSWLTRFQENRHRDDAAFLQARAESQELSASLDGLQVSSQQCQQQPEHVLSAVLAPCLWHAACQARDRPCRGRVPAADHPHPVLHSVQRSASRRSLSGEVAPAGSTR
jgi:hypothetical protein